MSFLFQKILLCYFCQPGNYTAHGLFWELGGIFIIALFQSLYYATLSLLSECSTLQCAQKFCQF